MRRALEAWTKACGQKNEKLQVAAELDDQFVRVVLTSFGQLCSADRLVIFDELIRKVLK